MSNEIQIKRGQSANFDQVELKPGEPAITLDTGKLYIGTAAGKTCINPELNIGTSPGQLVTVGSDGKISPDIVPQPSSLDAALLTGKIALEQLPAGALERCIIVADDTARFALTASQAQNGDTVKVTSTGKMYFITDDTKLSTEAGYEIYTAGTAAAVPWSGVTDRPTTLSGYGITDAAAANHTHPTDATRAPLTSPAFTGSPTAPTPAAADSSTKIATTAYVKGQGYLTNASTLDGGTF